MCEKLFLKDHKLSQLSNATLLDICLVQSSENSEYEKIVKTLQNNFKSSQTSLPIFYKINLDRTIFHPQGGGQPSDEGFLLINIDDKLVKFCVKFVKLAADLIQVDHFGWFEGVELSESEILKMNGNTNVECQIDMEKRDTFTKIHSAGHVLDLAIAMCGYQWKPGRGYHFVDSPYCEYFHCNQVPESMPKFVEQVNEKISELLNDENNTVAKTFIPFYSNVDETIINSELSSKFENNQIPSYLPPGQDVRFVKYGHVECACSGTHVDQFSEVGPFKVSKAKKQGQSIRISYNLTV